jgi:hypothetical protein
VYWFWWLMGFFILLGFHSLVISHHNPTYSAPRQEKARRWVRKDCFYFCKILFGLILFLIRYFSSLKWFICCNWFGIEITVETWNPNPKKQFIMTLSFRGGSNQCWLFLLFEEKLPVLVLGHNGPAPTSSWWKMDGKWSGNSFLLGSSSLVNHGG